LHSHPRLGPQQEPNEIWQATRWTHIKQEYDEIIRRAQVHDEPHRSARPNPRSVQFGVGSIRSMDMALGP